MHQLHDLALLYLAMAENVDGDLSYAEREAVTDNLYQRYAHLERAEVQNVVLEALTTHADGAALRGAAQEALDRLHPQLSEAQKTAVLQDLVRIARADGIVLGTERTLLAAVAERWKVPLPREATEPAPDAGSWEALHHLAYIYLVLAHAPDHAFSDDERLLVLKKLREWKPSLDDRAVRAVLERAIARYAQEPTREMLAASVEAVRQEMPEAQRKAALEDLVQIANADGVFLDSEEDLLNELMVAWDIDATYGSPGSKT